jgi:hypothetical protein
MKSANIRHLLRSLKPVQFILLLIPLSSVFLSCWYYSFSSTSLPGVENVYIPMFTNSTTEFGIEQKLTDAITNAVNADNILNIAERKNADAVLEGKIVGFSDELLSYTGGEQVTEYSVRITVKVRFLNLKTDKVLLDDTFTASHNYPSASPNERATAIDTALNKLAEDIINKAFSGW